MPRSEKTRPVRPSSETRRPEVLKSWSWSTLEASESESQARSPVASFVTTTAAGAFSRSSPRVVAKRAAPVSSVVTVSRGTPLAPSSTARRPAAGTPLTRSAAWTTWLPSREVLAMRAVSVTSTRLAAMAATPQPSFVFFSPVSVIWKSPARPPGSFASSSGSDAKRLPAATGMTPSAASERASAFVTVSCARQFWAVSAR